MYDRGKAALNVAKEVVEEVKNAGYVKGGIVKPSWVDVRILEEAVEYAEGDFKIEIQQTLDFIKEMRRG